MDKRLYCIYMNTFAKGAIMPKIIENLESRLIEEAQKQIEEAGYSAVTIRSVAKACGVGVGTVYNYFPSKEALIATHLLEDWYRCVAAVQAVNDSACRPEDVARSIHEQLVSFACRHQAIFRDDTAAASFSGSFSTCFKISAASFRFWLLAGSSPYCCSILLYRFSSSI